MREIKYRCWSKTTNEMLMDAQNMYDGLGEWFDSEGNEIDPYMGFNTSSFSELIDDSKQGRCVLMQYTGLKDKNGKEIYEGDILKDGKGQCGEVLWHRNSFFIEWQERGYDGHLLQDRMIDDCFGYGEVIGNIYEHPQLLGDN